MSDNVIEIRNIIRDFKLGQETVHVLKGIDLDIKRGDYVAIMGPSGSGKIYLDEFTWLLGYTNRWILQSQW